MGAPILAALAWLELGLPAIALALRGLGLLRRRRRPERAWPQPLFAPYRAFGSRPQHRRRRCSTRRCSALSCWGAPAGHRHGHAIIEPTVRAQRACIEKIERHTKGRGWVTGGPSW